MGRKEQPVNLGQQNRKKKKCQIQLWRGEAVNSKTPPARALPLLPPSMDHTPIPIAHCYTSPPGPGFKMWRSDNCLNSEIHKYYPHKPEMKEPADWPRLLKCTHMRCLLQRPLTRPRRWVGGGLMLTIVQLSLALINKNVMFEI